MIRIVLVSISISFSIVLSAFLSDEVKRFTFKKIKDGNNTEFFISFSYPINSTAIYNGIALNVNGSLYFMGDNKNITYWTEFTKEELENKSSFSKGVRVVDRFGDKFHFQTDFIDYSIVASGTETQLIQSDYQTMYGTFLWDLKNICFSKSDPSGRNLRFVVSSKNNGRKYNDTLHIEDRDQSAQKIKVKSGYYDITAYDEYDIKFTADELSSNETFCKGVLFDPCEDGTCELNIRIETSPDILNIDPNALKSLIG